mgnify:CR=1 FL=1
MISFSLVNYFYSILRWMNTAGLILEENFAVEPAKIYIVDLCQFPCLIFWGRRMKTLIPHLKLWNELWITFPPHINFTRNRKTKPCLITKTGYLPYYTSKLKIKCPLPHGLVLPGLILQFRLPCVHTSANTVKAKLNVSVQSCEYKHVQTSSVYIGPVFGGLPEDFTLLFVLSSYYSVLWIVWFCCR